MAKDESWARKGIICSFGKIDSGFKGNLTLLGLNSSEDEVNIELAIHLHKLFLKNFLPLLMNCTQIEAEIIKIKRELLGRKNRIY